MEGHRRSFPIIRFIFKVRKLLVGLWVVEQSNFDWTGLDLGLRLMIRPEVFQKLPENVALFTETKLKVINMA